MATLMQKKTAARVAAVPETDNGGQHGGGVEGGATVDGGADAGEDGGSGGGYAGDGGLIVEILSLEVERTTCGDTKPRWWANC